MNEVVIAGAGGFGHEVLRYAQEAASEGWPHKVVGFLDDDPAALAGRDTQLGVVGPLAGSPLLAADVIIALGDPSVRRRVRLAVAAAGGRLLSLVHPRAYVATGARIGDGVIVAPQSFIGADSLVAANCVVNAQAAVGHDARVGVDAVLSPGAVLGGFAHVGEGALLGTRTTVNPGVRIGAWSRIAAGSVVTGDCVAGSLLVGNPAKGRVMFRSPDEP